MKGFGIQGLRGGPIPPCPFSFEYRGIYSRKGRKGDAFYLPLSTSRPWREVLGVTPSRQTPQALRSVDLSCGERDSPVRPLPVVFFADDSREVEW